MNTTKILDSEIQSLKIASLPTYPNAEAKYGGVGYSGAEMKAAFDRLPLFIISRLNSLLDDISAQSGGVSSEIKTGISDRHTLENLFSDIKSGAFASYLELFEMPLAEHISRIYERLEALEGGNG